MNKQLRTSYLVFGAGFGLLSVVLGAMGAHALKEILTEDAMHSFETGIRYQMYHALAILLVGLVLKQGDRLLRLVQLSWVTGTLFFSFSIYALVLGNAYGIDVKFLGPVTPLGGFLLIIGWSFLLLHLIKKKVAQA